MLPYATLITINASSRSPQYQQLTDRLLHLIKEGTIKAGSKLPSSRELSKIVQVHRKTVIAAYDELNAQGWIVSQARSGYYVNARLPLSKPLSMGQPAEKFPDLFLVSLPARSIPANQDLETTVRPKLIIDDGLPDGRIAPYQALHSALRQITQRTYKLKQLNTGSTGAASPLKEALVNYLSRSRGFTPEVKNLLTTNGAQMGIYLCAQLLIHPGEVVAVGTPGYSLAHTTFLDRGAKLTALPVDNDGLDVDRLEQLCRTTKIKLVYVVPHHHYPTTVTLSPQRRLQLIELSCKYDFVILEDDYDYDYHYSSSPHLPLASYAHNGRVIYIGSLSKCFAASLRLGFLVASADFIATAANFRRSIDIRGDHVLEDAVAKLLESGEMDRHIKRSVKLYRERRDLICHAMDQKLNSYLTYVKPAGGLAVWLNVKRGYNVSQLSRMLRKKGIFLGERLIFGEDQHLNHLRIGFASLDNDEINELIESLAEVFRTYPHLPHERQT